MCQGEGPRRSCAARKIESEQPPAKVRSVAEIVSGRAAEQLRAFTQARTPTSMNANEAWKTAHISCDAEIPPAELIRNFS